MGFQHLTPDQRKANAARAGAAPHSRRGFSDPDTAKRAARKRWAKMLDNEPDAADNERAGDPQSPPAPHSRTDLETSENGTQE